MALYLCPVDKRFSCSWEGNSEDILEHFQQEHDTLLYFDDAFTVDLREPSENRLFFLDEEIYLLQTKMVQSKLVIQLRYLGPQYLAKKIRYTISVENKQFTSQVNEQGAIEIEISESDFNVSEYLSCNLNIFKNFGLASTTSIHEICFDENNYESLHPPDRTQMTANHSFEENNVLAIPKMSKFTRSNTLTLEEIKKRNSVKRTKSTISLGSIRENISNSNCSKCGINLRPPIYVCPCDQNFCLNCQNGTCPHCNEDVTFSRNEELEEKYNKFLFPCKYEKLGCPEKLIYCDLHNHETYCTFCVYRCPMDECNFEGQFKSIYNHVKLIHRSTKCFESFILVFQHISEAFLVNEEKGIFYCSVKYLHDYVLWEAKFCGPKERRFFCELKFKEGRHEPLLLSKFDNVYMIKLSISDLKRRKLKAKNAVLTIAC